MRVALYTGTRPGAFGAYNRLVRRLTRGPYSHVEIELFPDQWASASLMDGGVRLKQMSPDPARWDVLEIEFSDARVAAARQWFFDRYGAPYDLIGQLHSVWHRLPHRDRAWFCSEAVAAALGMPEPARYHPNSLARALFPGPHEG